MPRWLFLWVTVTLCSTFRNLFGWYKFLKVWRRSIDLKEFEFTHISLFNFTSFFWIYFDSQHQIFPRACCILLIIFALHFVALHCYQNTEYESKVLRKCLCSSTPVLTGSVASVWLFSTVCFTRGWCRTFWTKTPLYELRINHFSWHRIDIFHIQNKNRKKLYWIQSRRKLKKKKTFV